MDVIMQNGTLCLTRTNQNNQIIFEVAASNGERIIIRQDFMGVTKGSVRVAINAPQNVKILRGELLSN